MGGNSVRFGIKYPGYLLHSKYRRLDYFPSGLVRGGGFCNIRELSWEFLKNISVKFSAIPVNLYGKTCGIVRKILQSNPILGISSFFFIVVVVSEEKTKSGQGKSVVGAIHHGTGNRGHTVSRDGPVSTGMSYHEEDFTVNQLEMIGRSESEAFSDRESNDGDRKLTQSSSESEVAPEPRSIVHAV